MRIVIVLLILANATLFAFTRLDTGSGEAILLQDQVQPDKIKLLTPQQVAALGPTKVASLADVCVEWGPFSDADRTRALADLEPLALGRLVSQRRVDNQTLVIIRDPQQTAMTRLRELAPQYAGSNLRVTACERTS